MVAINLKDQALTAEFTANAAVSDGEVVAVTGANAVEPATGTNTQAAAGVADGAAAAGETVDVVILGRKTVTADGAVNPGEPIRAAATAGRVVSETTNPASHSHGVANHSHVALQSGGTDTTAGAHQAMTDGAGSGTTLQVGVDTSGQAADTVSTDANGPGSTDAGDAAPEHARVVGKALTSAAAAGDSIDVLVALTG